MLFEISKHEAVGSAAVGSAAEWKIVALEGYFAGREVASAEGLVLEGATFFGDKIFARIKSSWGITMLDEVTTSRGMLRSLGIGAPFVSEAEVPFVFLFDTFVCAETQGVIRKSRHVMLFNLGMFYSF